MPSDYVRVIAEVRLLSTAEGGKAGPISGSYRPNHNFFREADADMTVGFVELPAGVLVQPGEKITVPIAFRRWAGLAGQIYVGREWRIQEGHRLVAIGRIIEVRSEVT